MKLGMKIILGCIFSLATCNANEVIKLSADAKHSYEIFVQTPTSNNYETAKAAAEKIIQVDPDDGRGQLALIRLYDNSIEDLLPSGKDKYSLMLGIIDEYMKRPNRKGDLSRLYELAKARRDHEKAIKEFNQSEQRRAWYAKKPESVILSEKILQEYRQELNAGKKPTTDLRRAMQILTDDLQKDPNNYKIYLGMFDVAMQEADYARAYIMWKLAVSNGANMEDHNVMNASEDLYSLAMNYEISNDIRKGRPGPSPDLYFIWLERACFTEYISDEYMAVIKKMHEDTRNIRLKLMREQ